MPREVKKVLKVKPIPVPLGNQHPEPKFEELPKHEFTIGIVAPKGSGKTTLIANLLKAYQGYFHNIVIFSPTVLNDDKWDWVKKQPLLGENKKLKEFIRKEQIKESKNEVVQPPAGYIPEIEKEDEFDPFIPEDCFMAEYSESDLLDILKEQQKVVEWLKSKGKSKHLANRILFVFDDMVGSNLFSNDRQNAFKMLNTNHRHKSASLIIVSQAYREIPKTPRTNFSCLVLFEILSEAELEAIMTEFPMGMKKNEWLMCYHYCVEGEFNFLFYNMQIKEKRLRVFKNFDEHVYVERE